MLGFEVYNNEYSHDGILLGLTLSLAEKVSSSEFASSLF